MDGHNWFITNLKTHCFKSFIFIFSLQSETVEKMMKSTHTAANMTSFKKSKEDFIWFIKTASTDIKSAAHAEQYHSWLKMFIDADNNKEDLVSKASNKKLWYNKLLRKRSHQITIVAMRKMNQLQRK